MLSSLPLLVAWAAVLSSSARAFQTPRTGSAFVPQSAHFLPQSVRGATCSFPAPGAEARLRVGTAPLVVRQGVTAPQMSQSFDMEGKLKIVYETQNFGDKGFTKREFVVTMADEQYPQDVKFELIKDNTGLIDRFRLGDDVKVSFNLRGNEWNGRYFTNLQAWRLDSMGQSQAQYQAQTDASAARAGDAPWNAVGKMQTAAAVEMNLAAVSLTVASWNLDGISDDGLFPVQRAAKAAGILLDTHHGALPLPDFIALQEVTPNTIRVIEKCFTAGGYVDAEKASIPPSPHDSYFTKCYVRRDSPWRCTTSSRTPFAASRMGRDLLTVSLSSPIGLSARVATAHLESTGAEQEQRLTQLRSAMAAVAGAPAPHFCALIGDLNLGAKDQVQDIAARHGMEDAFGGEKPLRYTWDCNTNLNIQSQFMIGRPSGPKCRFDRCYFKVSEASGGTTAGGEEGGGVKLSLVTKDLIGIEPVELEGDGSGITLHPSDHYGLRLRWEAKDAAGNPVLGNGMG